MSEVLFELEQNNHFRCESPEGGPLFEAIELLPYTKNLIDHPKVVLAGAICKQCIDLEACQSANRDWEQAIDAPVTFRTPTVYGGELLYVAEDRTRVAQNIFNDNVKTTQTKVRSVINREPATDPLTYYMRDMGKHPLLTKPEVKTLATATKKAVAIKAQLQLENREPTDNERIQLEDGAKAKEKLIQSNLRLVVKIAKSYPIPQGSDFIDIIQAGNIGLEHAIDKYDIDTGFAFSTYSTNWIKQSIRRYLDRNRSLIKLPATKGTKLASELRESEKNGGIFSTEVTELKRLMNIDSLDRPLNQDADSALIDFQKSDYQLPEDAIERLESINTAEQLLKGLSDDEKMLLTLRYGLFGTQPKTIQELSIMYKTEKSSMQAKIRRIILKIRKTFEEE